MHVYAYRYEIIKLPLVRGPIFLSSDCCSFLGRLVIKSAISGDVVL